MNNQIKVDYIDHMGTDLTIVNAARVSFDKESSWGDSYKNLSEKDKKLVHYLAKHKHLSPFGHCFFSCRVTAPVFVSRQLVKHKFLRINEISRRYVDTLPEFYAPEDWRSAPTNKKQGSGSNFIEELTFNGGIVQNTEDAYDDVITFSLELYDTMIKNNIAPEQARMVLPQSMMTSWYWSGSLDAFAAMAKLRLKPDAQYETRIVAEQVENIIKPIFPVSWEALLSYE